MLGQACWWLGAARAHCIIRHVDSEQLLEVSTVEMNRMYPLLLDKSMISVFLFLVYFSNTILSFSSHPSRAIGEPDKTLIDTEEYGSITTLCEDEQKKLMKSPKHIARTEMRSF